MKAEHRHELKTNDLAEWLANFPQWAKKNRNTIIYLVVLIIAVIGLYIWKGITEPRIAEQKKIEFTLLAEKLRGAKDSFISGKEPEVSFNQIANSFEQFAQKTKNGDMAAAALIRQAQALRMDLHYRSTPVLQQTIESNIKKAQASYNEAIEKTSTPTLLAEAKLGLGLCEEELGNFEQAKELYKSLSTNTDLERTVAAAQAKMRLASISDYEKKIVFKPAPLQLPTMPMGTTQPPIELNLPELNQPNQPSQ